MNKEYTFIGNNCIGGDIFKQFNHPYTNPFMWTFLTVEDYQSLVENFNDIDFDDIQMTKASSTKAYHDFKNLGRMKLPQCLCFILNNKYEILCPHHQINENNIHKISERFKNFQQTKSNYIPYFVLNDTENYTEDGIMEFLNINNEKLAISRFDIKDENHIKKIPGQDFQIAKNYVMPYFKEKSINI